MTIVVLAGGTGGAKLARGVQDVVGPERLAVVANTGDDVEVYGVHVSPDPDLVTWWLAGIIDPRGWGIAGDTWERMAELEAAGEETWFRLGDRDLELCALRSERLRAGDRLTEAHAAVAREVGVRTRVLPMTDGRVQTRVRSSGRWLPFQEFMVAHGASGPVEGVELGGADHTRPSPAVLAALEEAEAIVIGPSNPVISIGPILAVPGMREAIRAARARVVAVSPFVGGRAVKGPTEAFCDWAGIARSAQGVLDHYGDLLDGLVADEPGEGLPVLEAPTVMDTPAARAQVARITLDFASTLR